MRYTSDFQPVVSLFLPADFDILVVSTAYQRLCLDGTNSEDPADSLGFVSDSVINTYIYSTSIRKCSDFAKFFWHIAFYFECFVVGSLHSKTCPYNSYLKVRNWPKKYSFRKVSYSLLIKLISLARQKYGKDRFNWGFFKQIDGR